jgi:zinc protease
MSRSQIPYPIRRQIAISIFATVIVLTASTRPAQAIEIERVVSPGGIKAWLVRDTSVPLLSIEFSFRGGQTYDPKGKAGLSNFVSGLLDEGAGSLDSKLFQAELQNRSIRMSFAAGRDTFRGSLKALNQHRDKAIELLALALTQPRFDAEPLKRMRQQILVSLKSHSTNPDYIAGRTWSKVVYGEHPYSMASSGTEETIRSISRADLMGFVKKRFARNLLIVGVTGDITSKELGPLLDRAFSALPTEVTLSKVAKAPVKVQGETYVVDLDVPQSSIIFGQPGVQRDDPDWYTAFLMNYILGGGGFGSRLYSEIREKRGLAYSVSTYLHPMQLSALISGSAGTKNERVAESLNLVKSEWSRMRNDGVTVEELERAKSYLTGSFPLRLSSTNAIARMLVFIQYHNLGIDYIDKRASYINAVSRDRIAKLARKLLDPDKLIFVVVGKPKDVQATARAPQF